MALFLLPYCVIRVTEGKSHSLFSALIYISISAVILYFILICDTGFDAPDGTMGARLLVPYLILSIPLSFATFGIVGWMRKSKLIR